MNNRVRARREERECSQRMLADAVGLSRQSLTAIEAGRTTPSVSAALRIARFLETDVESLFGGESAEELDAALASTPKNPSARVLLGCVRGHWVAHPLSAPSLAASPYAADGFVRKVLRGGQARIELSRALPELRDTVLIGGCAPGLSVLADRLNGARGPGRFRWLMQSNTHALTSLARGHTHVAGVHLAKETPEKLAQTLARHLPTERAEVYALARWEAGLVLARGNPKRISGVADLASKKVRVAMRESGSGARQHFERLLRSVGCNDAALAARSFEVSSHMEVAQAIALGAADVGFSIRSAALAFELDFKPLLEERFDLVITEDMRADARVSRLLEMLASGSLRRELDELGYDASLCATKVTDVTA